MYDFGMSKKDTERPNWGTPIKLDAELDLWCQQSEESSEYFAAFRAYLELIPRANTQTRELGTRRLSELADVEITVGTSDDGEPETVSYSLRHLGRLAFRYCWEQRAREWDVSRNETMAGMLERRRLAIIANRLDLVGEIEGISLSMLKTLASDPERWRVRDWVAVAQLARDLGNDLMSMTRLGGPEQAQTMMAASQVQLTVGAAEALEAQTVELVEELQRRHAVGAREESA